MAGKQLLGHMVYFTLHDNSEEAKQKLLAACEKYLKGHPGVVFYAAGTHVPDLAREVNQKFDVALQLVFESREAHDIYQTHEKHVQFITENKPNWQSVRVFDAYVG